MAKFYSGTLALLALAAGVSSAQAQLFKCRDAAGHVTYTNEACDKQGLAAAGEVRERITVVPGPAARKPAASPGGASGADGPLPVTKLKPPGPIADTPAR